MGTIKLFIGMAWTMLEMKIIQWTHRLWNRQISRILCRAYNDRVIDSKQLHTLAAAFDQTQRHMVYGKYAEWSFGMLRDIREFRVTDGKKEGLCTSFFDHFVIEWDDGTTMRTIDLSNHGIRKVKIPS